MGDYKKNGKFKIAVILASMLGGDYSIQSLEGIAEEAERRNADIYIFDAEVLADENRKHTIGEYYIYDLVNFSLFDGVILFSNLIQEDSLLENLIKRIKESNVPAFSIDATIDGFYSIGVDNYNAMKSIVSHLIEQHHFTKINYLSGQDSNTDSQERLIAYCDALKEHSLLIEAKRIFKGDFTNVFGMQATETMLQTEEGLPEAIVCAADWVALGVRKVLERHGIEVPRQVAVTGFDNAFDARNSVPRLTTVDRDMRTVGRKAVEGLLRVINGEEVLQNQKFSAVPVIAGSCGCVHNEETGDRTIRIKYLNYKEQTEQRLRNIGVMIENLTESTSLDKFLERLKTYIMNLECRAFYLCLGKEYLDNLSINKQNSIQGDFRDASIKKGISDKHEVVLAYENGRFRSYGEFMSQEMLPELENEEEKQHVFAFSPLHFQDDFIGYVVLDYCKFAIESPIFNTWMRGLAIALETLRKHIYLKNMLEKLENMYVTEPLTGLYNRFGFMKNTTDCFKQCIDTGEKLMILFVDLDGLKNINDIYGHEKGDIAICAVADALKEACLGQEICARFGGDEYVVFSQGYTEKDAVEFCERFEQKLGEKNQILQQPFHIEASYGYITVKPKAGESIDKYIDMADNIMYCNKKSKKAKKKRKDYHKIEKNS